MTSKAEIVNIQSSDPLDFYKSITHENRETERTIIQLSFENGVFPSSIRYDLFRDTYRGIIKSQDKQFYYFQLPPNLIFHIVKADDETKEWEANKLYKTLSLGCDIIKSNTEDEELEDEKKAAPMGGGTGTLPPASTPEVQEVASQANQITEVHPGATSAQTPQQDGASERWHKSLTTGSLEQPLPPINSTINPNAWSTTDLLKAWGQQLQASAPKPNTIDPKLRQYLVEVVGRSPQEIDNGYIRLNGMQRSQYNRWLTKSLRSKLDSLSTLLKK